MTRTCFLVTKACACLMAGAVSIATATEISFQGLDDLLGGDFYSSARAISGDGLVVVGQTHGPSGSEAFKWTSTGGMVGLGDLTGGDFLSTAFAASWDGSVIAGQSQSGSSAPDYQEAFRWTEQDGMQGLGDFAGSPFKSAARDISDDGSTIVGWGYPGMVGAPSPIACSWTQTEGMVELGELPGGFEYSLAYAVSGDGSVIVGYSWSSNGTEAFRWTAEDGMVGLGDLAGGQFYSVATAVSADGSVIFGAGDIGYGDYQGFRWTAETGMVSIGPNSHLNDVSADGSVGIGDAGGEAYIWDEVHGKRLVRDVLIANGIDMDDWMLAYGRSISADGTTIVGTGYHDGVTEAWIAHIPEPATAWLLTAAALMALRRRR